MPCAQLCHVSLVCYHPATLSLLLSAILTCLRDYIELEKLPREHLHLKHLCWLICIALDIHIMAQEDANVFPAQPEAVRLCTCSAK